jgi:hypothetical protein
MIYNSYEIWTYIQIRNKLGEGKFTWYPFVQWWLLVDEGIASVKIYATLARPLTCIIGRLLPRRILTRRDQPPDIVQVLPAQFGQSTWR